MNFQVIEGGKDGRTTVCTWCASTFLDKEALAAHWAASPSCNSNRNVSNPLQSKYGSAAGIENVPGEALLNAVRQEGCRHPRGLREPMYPPGDLYGQRAAIGFRCGHCYSEVLFTLREVRPSDG